MRARPYFGPGTRAARYLLSRMPYPECGNCEVEASTPFRSRMFTPLRIETPPCLRYLPPARFLLFIAWRRGHGVRPIPALNQAQIENLEPAPACQEFSASGTTQSRKRTPRWTRTSN